MKKLIAFMAALMVMMGYFSAVSEKSKDLYVLMTIPYFFWDYTDEKQFKVIEVLRRREEVTRKQMDAEKANLQEPPLEAAVGEEVLS